MELRHFGNGDVAEIRRLEYPDLSEKEISDLVSAWNKKSYNGRYFEIFAVTLDDRVIGNVSLYEYEAEIFTAGLMIYEPYRNRGYGRNALTLLAAKAKEKGLKALYAKIRADNVASKKVAEKVGFILSDEQNDSKGNRVYIMKKDL